MKNGPWKVWPPSYDETPRYWFSSGVSKFSNATYRKPVCGLTVGFEPWLSSQFVPPAKLPTQTAPWSGVCEFGPPIATHGRDHVNPPFVERLTQTPLVSSVRLKLIWT